MPTLVAGDYFDAATHRYYLGHREVPGVTAVLKAAGLIDTTFLNNEEALRRGTAVHKLCEWTDLTMRDSLAGYRHSGLRSDALRVLGPTTAFDLAYEAFLSDHAPRYTHVERGLLHPTLRFGGRPDRICACLAGGGPAILEIKTGGEASWHAVQLAAYQLLYPTGSRWIVYLRDDGRYRLRRVTGHTDYARFIQALADYHTALGGRRA